MHADFALSGEPVAQQIAQGYGTEPKDEVGASTIARTNIEKREYQKEYMDYWNSTKNATGTDRPVDAFIMPLAPFPASRPKGYSYYGYSAIINSLDYTSCVIPVTMADKSIDVLEKGFTPVNELDKSVSESCKCHDQVDQSQTHAILQMIRRSLTARMSGCSSWEDDCKRRKCLRSRSTLVALFKRLGRGARTVAVGSWMFYMKHAAYIHVHVYIEQAIKVTRSIYLQII